MGFINHLITGGPHLVGVMTDGQVANRGILCAESCDWCIPVSRSVCMHKPYRRHWPHISMDKMWDPKMSSLLTKTWLKMINHWIFRIFFWKICWDNTTWPATAILSLTSVDIHWHPRLRSCSGHETRTLVAATACSLEAGAAPYFGTMLRHFLIVSTSCTVLFWGIHFKNPLEGCNYRFFVWPQVGVSILYWHIEKVKEHDPSTWSINVH